jgi:creatinine amidohydrolase
MAAHQLAHLRYPEVEALLASSAKTVALVPSGSTEAHGPHLPLATDSIISEGMALVAADKLAEAGYEAVVFPTLHYAVTDWAADFAGSTGLHAPTAEAMLLQALLRARALGFDAVVLCNAHLEPDNISALRSVAKAFEEQSGGALVFPDVTRRRVAQRLTPEFQSGSCHAGSYETSLVLALRPELVDMDIARELPAHIVPLHEHIAAGAKSFLECGLDRAYCGTPSEATAEEGHETLAVLAEITLEMVRDRLGDTPG